MKKLIALLIVMAVGTVYAGQITQTTAEMQTILDQAAQVVGTKLAVTNEIHATSVLEAGLISVNGGTVSIADQDLSGWVNLTASNGIVYVDEVGLCELSLTDNTTQDFTSGAGFEVVTNFTDNAVDLGYSTTDSNITVSVAGRYRISSGISFDTDEISEMHLRVYTNGVALVDYTGNVIGWERNQGVQGSKGFAGFSRMVELSAGSVVNLRVDAVGANETITWHSGNFLIEKK